MIVSQFFDKLTRQWLPADEYHALRASRRPRVAASSLACPYVQSDIAEYRSVASGKMITSRSQQRDDLDRTNCRLVDPSEFEPSYRSAKSARKAAAARKARKHLPA